MEDHVSLCTLLIKEDNAVHACNHINRQIDILNKEVDRCKKCIEESPEFSEMYEKDIRRCAVKLLGLKMELIDAERAVGDARAEILKTVRSRL